MNCQLEAAGIAGTRTPSSAASNYQLGWVFLWSREWEIGNGESSLAKEPGLYRRGRRGCDARCGL